MKYSVIIPVWNEEHNITDCVNSIRILNLDAEIIVADGHSTDGTLTIADQAGNMAVFEMDKVCSFPSPPRCP